MLLNLLLTLVVVVVAVLLLGIRVFFTKNGKFPETHVGKSKELSKKGISCIKTQDLQERKRSKLADIQ